MTLAEIMVLVAQGESENLEFKETTGQRGEGAKAVCAMLNSQGGYVLFGVTDRGEVRGQIVSARTQEEVDRELRRIEPPAFPAIEVVPVRGAQSVLVVRMTARFQGPYTYDGRPYLRQGPQTLVMPRNRYEFRAGIIESWGSGTVRMIEACRTAGRPLPVWENEPDELRLILPTPQATPQASPQATPEVQALLVHCLEPRSRQELQSSIGLRDNKHFREAYLQPALEGGLIEMTLADKPRSPLQRYRLTPAGLLVVRRDEPYAPPP